jgi:hypothetical protein
MQKTPRSTSREPVDGVVLEVWEGVPVVNQQTEQYWKDGSEPIQ